MKGYKGFNPGMVCRDKQYAENTVYEEDQAEICKSGMHFCEFPFDVWSHYPPVNDCGELNEFAEVEALEEAKTEDGLKFCTTKLQIGAKLPLPDLIKIGVDFIIERAEDIKSNTGDRSAATNTGYRSAATNTGDRSAATNTGDYSAATNTGYRSAASAEGKESFAINTGYFGKAKGALGGWIACAEWAENDEGSRRPVDFRAVKVDGKSIKADTWYRLKDGKFVEANE